MLMLILFTLQVSNRRSRRWLNDRLLMELVPRLNAEEIRGLFAPPPFGNYIYEQNQPYYFLLLLWAITTILCIHERYMIKPQHVLNLMLLLVYM